VNAATTIALAATVTVFIALEDEVGLDAVRVTEYEPAATNACAGFWLALVDPSPKFQLHDVGLPVDASVNWMDWLTAGEPGLYVKDAASAITTVTVLLTLFEPELLVTVKVTVLDPAEV
jgi:hypothetical protein